MWEMNLKTRESRTSMSLAGLVVARCEWIAPDAHVGGLHLLGVDVLAVDLLGLLCPNQKARLIYENKIKKEKTKNERYFPMFRYG